MHPVEHFRGYEAPSKRASLFQQVRESRELDERISSFIEPNLRIAIVEWASSGSEIKSRSRRAPEHQSIRASERRKLNSKSQEPTFLGAPSSWNLKARVPKAEETERREKHSICR